MNITTAFLKKIHEVSQVSIPPEVLLRAVQALQDHLAVAAAGAKLQEEKLRKYLDFASLEDGDLMLLIPAKKNVTFFEDDMPLAYAVRKCAPED